MVHLTRPLHNSTTAHNQLVESSAASMIDQKSSVSFAAAAADNSRLFGGTLRNTELSVIGSNNNVAGEKRLQQRFSGSKLFHTSVRRDEDEDDLDEHEDSSQAHAHAHAHFHQ